MTDDARAFLSRRTPAQWHAIARLLVIDGPALGVHDWIVSQPDCDRATLAMIFWRARHTPRGHRHPLDIAGRNALLHTIAARVAETLLAGSAIAWDGREACTGEELIGAQSLPGINAIEVAEASLHGPFSDYRPEIALCAFLDEPYEIDDIFDDWWMRWYVLAGILDQLDGASADDWIFAIDDLASSHPTDVYRWMVARSDFLRRGGRRNSSSERGR